MVTEDQVKLLFKLVYRQDMLVLTAAVTADMGETTARKYLRHDKLPSEVKQPHTWRTRKDPFAKVWEEVVPFSEVNPHLEVKALFVELQRRYPGRFKPGQLRTLQGRVRHWRAIEGPSKEVCFDQVYEPGERAQSDFTCMNELDVTIQGEPFKHLLYHFVLPYSNWETGTVCRSESFEALSEGLQKALRRCGGVPRLHRTDSMSCAVRNLQRSGANDFTDLYQALMRHCGMQPRHTQALSPHENGKIEQRHYRLERTLRNQLILRGSHDFESHQAYARFLKKMFTQLNKDCQARFAQKRDQLRALPDRRLESYTHVEARVSKGSTIRVQKNCYWLPSRLIGEKVVVRVFADMIEVWYGQRRMARMPRLRGQSKNRIEYRHVIDSLVKKPGAFAHYRYREDLFPTHRFRVAHDVLHKTHASHGARTRYICAFSNWRPKRASRAWMRPCACCWHARRP